MENNNKKDFWDKLGILSKPLGALLTAFIIAGIGIYGNYFLERRQSKEMKTRLYTELISNREQSESALRKDMFTSIIGSFLAPESGSLEAKVLNLELLAYNFHESLNLKPLFLHLKKQIETDSSPDSADYMKRVKKVAKEIKRKQMAILKGAGDRKDIDIPWTEVGANGKVNQHVFCLAINAQVDNKIIRYSRSFKVIVQDFELTSEEIGVRLDVWPPYADEEECSEKIAELEENLVTLEVQIDTVDSSDEWDTDDDWWSDEEDYKLQVDTVDSSDEWGTDDLASDEEDSLANIKALETKNDSLKGESVEAREIWAEFAVDFFDFPMIDNTRLSNDQRCAIVLKGINEENKSIEIAVLYFPGSHASLKEKPYYDDIVAKLLAPALDENRDK